MFKKRQSKKDFWEIKKEDFPRDGNLEEKIKFILKYAILAPSTHNSQPWRFKIEAGFCKIYYDKDTKLPEADPCNRDLYISMGCMLENLIIATDYFGLFGDLKIEMKDNYIGLLFFKSYGEINKDLEHLVDSMPQRVNARGLFRPNLIPSNIIDELSALNHADLIKTEIITDKSKIDRLASLTAEGLKMAHGKKSFRKEMSKWIHNDFTRKKDGMPGYSLRMPFVLSFIIPVLIKYINLSPLFAKLNYKSVASAPMICILSSSTSDPMTWLETGRLAQRYMLHLNYRKVRTSIFVASIEMGELYKKVQEITGSDKIPQFLFCAGYMDKVQRHSPRANLESKLI